MDPKKVVALRRELQKHFINMRAVKKASLGDNPLFKAHIPLGGKGNSPMSEGSYSQSSSSSWDESTQKHVEKRQQHLQQDLKFKTHVARRIAKKVASYFQPRAEKELNEIKLLVQEHIYKLQNEEPGLTSVHWAMIRDELQEWGSERSDSNVPITLKEILKKIETVVLEHAQAYDEVKKKQRETILKGGLLNTEVAAGSNSLRGGSNLLKSVGIFTPVKRTAKDEEQARKRQKQEPSGAEKTQKSPDSISSSR